MIDRLDVQIGAHTGKVWFLGRDSGGYPDVGFWLEDGHVHLELTEGLGYVARLSPAAAVQLAKAILTEYDTPTRPPAA